MRRDLQVLSARCVLALIATLGNVATVSDGRFGGVTPTGDNPSENWRCPYCGSFGPWNGSICLNCNHRDDLDY